jgi:D-alanyl-D-alanine carboxypeptidase (penicillin-binding protein 5/6)
MSAVVRCIGLAAGLLVGLSALAGHAQTPLRPGTAAAAQTSQDISIKARQAILMDADTGAVLYQRNPDELAPPASMSKLMTLAVLFKSMKEGKTRPEDEFLMSEFAWRTGGGPSGTSAMFVPINTRIRVDELIKGIIIQSGNDASIAVAEGLAGTESAFTTLMTNEARRLGMTKSEFRNATGLYHPEHVMTVRELAILARHLITSYPEQYPTFAVREFPYRKHKFINRNPLLFLNIGVDGMKTGYVKEAGFGIVASAKQNDRRIIAVINGAATADDRRDEARRLIEWGFRAFGEFKLFEAGEVVGRARVWGGDRMSVPLVGKGPVMVVLPRAAATQRLRAELVYVGPLKPPIAKGDPVGTLRVTAVNDATAEVPLYAGEDVPAGPTWRRGVDSLLFLATRWLP